MYLLVICDDMELEIEKTEQIIDRYKLFHPELDLVVECFESAEELVYMVREENYEPDLIFLDIYMSGLSGTEAARKMRAMGNKSGIVFLTTSTEHALEAFGVDAAQYLVKPVTEEMVFRVLDRFLESEREMRRKYLILRVEGRIRRVAVSEIIYCEAQGKTQCLYLTDNEQLILRKTMAEIFGMLSQYPEFVRVGSAYIMNLEYIDNLNALDICLTTGEKLYLPRGAYKLLKEQYFRYYCGENETGRFT